MARGATVGAFPTIKRSETPYFTPYAKGKGDRQEQAHPVPRIQNGRMSGQKQPDGSYLINPAELPRVFAPFSSFSLACGA